MNECIKLNKGQEIFIGKPKLALPKNAVEELKKIIKLFPNVEEAHIPQVYIPESDLEPRQVLVLVISGDSNEIVANIYHEIKKKFSSHFSIDIWPLESNAPYLNNIREANMKL